MSSHSDLTCRLWGRGAAPSLGDQHPPIILATSRDPSLQSGEQLANQFLLRKRSILAQTCMNLQLTSHPLERKSREVCCLGFFLVKYLLRKFQS